MFPYYTTRLLLRFLQIFLLAHKKVYGLENLPEKGPYIGVVNHVGLVDAPLFLIALPPMKLRFFAAEKWGEHPISGPIMRWIGGIFINRGEADRQSLREALAALQAGYVFGVAPEGTRSKTGSMARAKDGAAYLASRAKVPIVPVGLVNTERVIDNAKQLRPTKVEVRIGQPFMLPDIGRRAKGIELSAYTHYIMIHVADLIPKTYHGYYGDSPALTALKMGEDPWPHCLAAESAYMAEKRDASRAL